MERIHHSPFYTMKKIFYYLLILFVFASILFLFWQEEMRYALPTPIPSNYQIVNIHTDIDINRFTKENGNKPIFLHFFNPDCPCSRFNITHFQDLVNQYKHKINFYAVLQVEDTINTIAQFKGKYKLTIPVIIDSQKLLAKQCGVYSTPQAVILDKSSKLYYRGNYNRARYCTDPRSNFAQMAIDSILVNKPSPYFGYPATTAYGCELPLKANLILQ